MRTWTTRTSSKLSAWTGTARRRRLRVPDARAGGEDAALLERANFEKATTKKIQWQWIDPWLANWAVSTWRVPRAR